MNFSCFPNEKQVMVAEFSETLVLLCVLNMVSAIVATIGNSLTLLTICRTPSLHSPSNVLLAGLALADLGIGILIQPCWIVDKMIQLKGSCSLYSSPKGPLFILPGNLLVSISFFNLTAFSVDRLLAIKLHLRYQQLVTVKRVLLTLVFIWFVSVAFNVWRCFGSSTLGNSISVVLVFVLSFVVILCYIQIFKVVRHHQLHIQAENSASLDIFFSHKKSIVTMLYVCGCFLLSYLPWACVIFAGFTTRKNTTVKYYLVRYVAETILNVNSCINPMIYCWRMVEMRQAFKLKVVKMCTNRLW